MALLLQNRKGSFGRSILLDRALNPDPNGHDSIWHLYLRTDTLARDSMGVPQQRSPFCTLHSIVHHYVRGQKT